MKAIILCDKPEKAEAVFPESVRKRIADLCELASGIYTKSDITRGSLSDTELIFSTWGMPQFTSDEINAYLPRLSCVFYAAGTVQRFARPFLEAGVRVYSAWAANAVPVAEYTVSQIILANKGYFLQTRLMADKKLEAARALSKKCVGNYKERVGLIGCGMIGSLVAKMLKAYSLEVCVFDPFLSDEKASELGVKKLSLEELFATCRVVSNHLANNEATKGMLSYEYFSKMMPRSTFINTGRGAQVVEADLVRTLCERPDITALLDVTYPEPAELSHPFYTLPNCFLTPHIAGSLGTEVVRMAEYMADELELYLSGSPTRFEVTPKMLETMA